jgi:hypothetical protein
MPAPLALLSAALALFLSFAISNKASKFGLAVATRFLERGSVVPPGNLPLTAETLDRWRSDPDNRAYVQGYASCILPLDVAFLLSLGSFFGFGSTALAGLIDVPNSGELLLWVFPVLYMATDLTEDMLIRGILLSPSSPAGRFAFMRRMTKAKVATSIVCFAQVFVLSIWSILRWAIP